MSLTYLINALKIQAEFNASRPDDDRTMLSKLKLERLKLVETVITLTEIIDDIENGKQDTAKVDASPDRP